MTLPHMTICDCVTERTGKPHVTIPRAQHDALIAAVKALVMVYNISLRRRHDAWVRAAEALLALHAAGIETEG